MNELSASEAIYAFAGWLSSRWEAVHVGAVYDCSPLVKAIEDFCQEKELSGPRLGWHLAQAPEPECVRGKPDGFYLLSGGEDAPERCLVRLYTPLGAACRHLGWGPWDGAAFMPVHDLTEESALTPVRIFTCAGQAPTDDLDAGVGPLGDAYHSIEELYLHRHRLFLALLACSPDQAWISRVHHGEFDPCFGGEWFIAGLEATGTEDDRRGDITYHLPIDLWDEAAALGCRVLPQGLPWDGHTPDDVLERLQLLARNEAEWRAVVHAAEAQ